MCKKVIYPEMNQEVRMEVINDVLLFSVVDIAKCMCVHPNALAPHKYPIPHNRQKFKDIKTNYKIVGVDKKFVHYVANRSRKDYSAFLSWFDQVYEENRPAPISETIVAPTDVPAVMQGFDKDKLKAFFEGAQEFFGMCAKLIA